MKERRIRQLERCLRKAQEFFALSNICLSKESKEKYFHLGYGYFWLYCKIQEEES
jgi:hypothetical protein